MGVIDEQALVWLAPDSSERSLKVRALRLDVTDLYEASIPFSHGRAAYSSSRNAPRTASWFVARCMESTATWGRRSISSWLNVMSSASHRSTKTLPAALGHDGEHAPDEHPDIANADQGLRFGGILPQVAQKRQIAVSPSVTTLHFRDKLGSAKLKNAVHVEQERVDHQVSLVPVR